MIGRLVSLTVAVFGVAITLQSGWLEMPHQEPGGVLCLAVCAGFAYDAVKPSKRS